jgi:hypothetical protein
MSPRRNWDSLTPYLASECAPPPGTKGGVAFSPAGEGLGESQFRRLEKSLALCLLRELHAFMRRALNATLFIERKTSTKIRTADFIGHYWPIFKKNVSIYFAESFLNKLWSVDSEPTISLLVTVVPGLLVYSKSRPHLTDKKSTKSVKGKTYNEFNN